MRRFPLAFCLFLAGAGLFVSATPMFAAVSVSLTPHTASLRTQEFLQFNAAILGTTDLRVKWYVNGIAGGNANLGTVSTTGKYTAPVSVPAASVTVKAVSVADPTMFDSSIVTLLNPIPVLTDIQPRAINTGLSTTIHAYGSKFVSGAVIYWGTAPLPTTFVSSTELRASYAPPEPAGATVVLRVRNPNPGAADSASTIAIGIAPPIVVLIGPATLTLRLGMTYPFGSYIGNAQDPSLKWYVNGISGGNASFGTISSAGVYTTPAVLPALNVIQIKVASVQDPRAFATSTVTLLNMVPSFTDLQTRFPNTGLATTFRAFGTNFVAGAQIYWGTVPLTTTFVSSTELRATYTPLEAAGTVVSLRTRNPNSGGIDSNQQDVIIQAPVSVTVAPSTATLRLGTAAQFYPVIQNAQNPALTWTVNGITGGNAALGTISAQGLYTPPALIPAPNVVEIKAASVQDPRAAAASSVTLLNAIPVVSGVTPALTTVTSTFTINGTGFARNATATLDGQPLTLSFVSPTQINAAGAIALPLGGFAVLEVTNPDPGASVSQAVGIPVTVPSSMLTYAAASRFLEQASWGPTPNDVGHVMQIGREAWLSEQFSTPASIYSDNIGAMPGLTSLQSQFMRNAVNGSDQLRQRVAFALGQLFVVSGQKLGLHSQMAPYQRLLLSNAFANFRDLLREVTLSPSMGNYLDMANNDKPSTFAANENYARELLQLFTIGPGPYTETDVKQMALVLTGWTYPPVTGVASAWPNPPNYVGQMVAFDNHHDTTAKTILGAAIPAGQTALQDLNSALDIVFNHPNVPQFVSYRLIQRLVTGNPSPAYVSRVAAVFANNGLGVRGDLQAVVRAILLDPEAATDGVSVLAPDQGHLREPVLYLTTLLRGLGAVLPQDTPVAEFADMMGQKLFYPPSVFNYFSPSYPIPGFGIPGPEFQILNASTMLARANVALLITHGAITQYASISFDRFDDLAGNVPMLLDAISNALLRGQMQPDMRASITTAISGLTDPFQRSRTALYLVATHARYQSQR